MDTIRIGVLGCGTVGTGVARILLERRDLLEARVGARLQLTQVADIDTTTDRGLALAPGVMIDDAFEVVNDPRIDIVVEMIGGEGVARELIQAAIDRGKQVVTANKALLAKQGDALFAAAAERGVGLAYEASVGGCMPIIKTLRESLVGNRITAMRGILNGTCNYILSKITDEGLTFKEALGQAQDAGFAEADPTLDVGGFDTAHKLAILTRLAYGTRVRFEDLSIEGIAHITPLDIQFAGQFGYRIKLLAIGKNHGDAVEARIHPTMIPADSLMANVSGSLNAVSVSGDAVGEILLHGHGAGRMPTASAVVGDIVDLARNLIHGGGGRVPVLGYQPDGITDIPVMPMEEIRTRYYFRFAVVDRPGVLSQIAGVLGRHHISIKSVHQKGRKDVGAVMLVILTHEAREAAVTLALAEIARLEPVLNTPVLIRIEDANLADDH